MISSLFFSPLPLAKVPGKGRITIPEPSITSSVKLSLIPLGGVNYSLLHVTLHCSTYSHWLVCLPHWTDSELLKERTSPNSPKLRTNISACWMSAWRRPDFRRAAMSFLHSEFTGGSNVPRMASVSRTHLCELGPTHTHVHTCTYFGEVWGRVYTNSIVGAKWPSYGSDCVKGIA